MLMMEILDKNEKVILTMDVNCNITTKDKRLRKAVEAMVSSPTRDGISSRYDGPMHYLIGVEYEKGTEDYLKSVYYEIRERLISRHDDVPKAYVQMVNSEDSL